MELNKYFQSETAEVMRSEIHPSAYNPREITDEGRKQLKRSIKKYGIVGGIVVNKGTGMTIVGGHQKVAVLDEINHYDVTTKENDYRLKVEMIDVDIKTEKQLNIVLNNPNVGGQWDYDKMRELVPDIDYKDAGLTEEDLNLIGCDYLLKTEAENDIAETLDDVMSEVNGQHRAEVEARKELRKAEKTQEERIRHMKDVKDKVNEDAQKKAQDMEAYVMLSFDDFNAKAQFMQRFGYDKYEKIIKGEVFDDQIERIE